MLIERDRSGCRQVTNVARVAPFGLHFRQPEIENFRVSALSHEQIRRLDVAMNDPAGVRGIERVGDLDT